MDHCDGLTGVPRDLDGRTLCSVCAEDDPRRDAGPARFGTAVGFVWLFIAIPTLIVLVGILLSKL